jgi:hypothetical protein
VTTQTADQFADEMAERVGRLLEYVGRESISAADAGLLLSASLQGLILAVEGKANNSMNLTDLTAFFLKVRKREQKATHEA